MISKFLALFLLGISFAQAMPAQVVLIRHAEKPASGDELSRLGEERAKALVHYLATNFDVNLYGPISAIFAAKPPSSHGSMRSIETVTPYARATGLQINVRFDKYDLKKMVKQIEDDSTLNGKTVLICFDHDSLWEIADDFGLDSPLWDKKSYDRTWLITFLGGRPKLRDLPQHVLPGDSPAAGNTYH